MTYAEIVLWSYLKDKQLDGHKFRRQHGITRFIADFYCPKFKLALELDGDIHLRPDVKEKDRIKTRTLEQLGILVLRFQNVEVIYNIEIVLDKIRGVIKTRNAASYSTK